MVRKENTQKLARLGMLAALSIVLIALVRIPWPAAPFLVYDPADVPILIAAFLYGPWWGVAVTAVVSLIQAFVLAGDGIIGGAMHLAATGAFCIAAGSIYRGKNGKSIKSAVMGLVIGSLAMTVVMAGCNLILTPIFMQTDRAAVIAMLVPTIIPFNLVKSGVNSVITFFVYKPVHRLFDKMASRG